MTQTAKPLVVAVAERVDRLEGRKVTYRAATVIGASPGGRLIDVDVPGAGVLAGLRIPEGSFFPAVGDVGELRQQGSRVSWVANRLAEGAVGDRELAEPVKQQITVALAAANGKNTITYSVLPPPDPDDGTGRTEGDPWWQLDWDAVVQGAWMWTPGAGWVAHTFGDAVFESISAAKIVTGILGVGVKVTVGDPATVHTVIDGARGLVIQAPDSNGVQRELNRYGRGYAVIDPVTGDFLASVDSAGRGSFTELDAAAISVAGQDLSDLLTKSGEGVAGRFAAGAAPDIQFMARCGVAEVGVELKKGRAYRVEFRCQFRVFTAGDEVVFRLLYSQGADGNTSTEAPAPTINSPVFASFYETAHLAGRHYTASHGANFYPGRTTRFRLLLTAERGAPDRLSTGWIVPDAFEMVVTDLGPAGITTGGFTTAGGTNLALTSTPPPPPSVVQQYTWEALPVGRTSFTGSGGHMNWAGDDVYQGYYPGNGDQRGMFWWNLPNITGTVDSVELFLYFRHWHFHSGGTARLGLTDQRGAFTAHTFRPTWDVPGWVKPGGRWIRLPNDWFPFFRGTNNNSLNGRATAITLGPGGGTNQVFYGVANAAALKIRFTQ